jgi:hypothetical protein
MISPPGPVRHDGGSLAADEAELEGMARMEAWIARMNI